jgi:hypothetical protein
LPAARIAFTGRWDDQDYLCETVAFRQGERGDAGVDRVPPHAPSVFHCNFDKENNHGRLRVGLRPGDLIERIAGRSGEEA